MRVIKASEGRIDAKLDAQFEELRQLIWGIAPSQSTHVDHVPPNFQVPANTAPTGIRGGYRRAAVYRRLLHYGTTQTGERVHRGAGTKIKQETDSHIHGFEQPNEKVEDVPVFEGEVCIWNGYIS
ncbi:hypothetical protein Tco_0441153 [Tanacetum coccineum]